MGVYRIQPLDFQQLSPGEIGSVTARFAQGLSTVDVPKARFVFRTVPIDLEGPIKRARQVQAAAVQQIDSTLVTAYIGMLAAQAGSRLRSLEHYLVLPDETSDGTANMLLSGMGLAGYPVIDLPPMLPARYRSEYRHLSPVVGNYPLYTVLVSYDMTGSWDPLTLTNLFQVGFPITVCVDIESHHGSEVHALLDKKAQVTEGLMRQLGSKSALQTQAVGLAALKEYVQQGEAVHQVSIAVLVPGLTEEELTTRAAEVEGKTSGLVLFARRGGVQHSLFHRYFTTRKENLSSLRKALPGAEAPLVSRNLHSSALATAVAGPLGISRRGDTEGVWWGLSRETPFFWDGFGPNLNRPNHFVWLGTTGSGKTASSLAILMREATLMGTQIIMLDPLGNCEAMVRAFDPDRTSYIPLSLNALKMNPVECIYGALQQQSAHLGIIISLLMGRPLQEAESIALERVAPLIYEGITPYTPPANQPRISDLARALKAEFSSQEVVRRAGESLGGLLEERFVLGPMSEVFDRISRADWRLERDIVAFDFLGMVDEEEHYRRLAYFQVLSLIQREAQRQKRSRRRLVWIDEFARLSAEPQVARAVATMYKTFRTLGVGVWALEQDLVTFVGLAGLQGSSQIDTSAGLQILNNTTGVVALAHKDAGAQVLPQQFPQIKGAHVQYLTSLRPKMNPTDLGTGLVVLGGEVYPLKVILSKPELSVLGGS